MTRRAYLRLWDKRHPGYKAADSRRRALFWQATRAFYREILGVRVRVNLIPLLKNLSDLSIVTGEAAFGM